MRWRQLASRFHRGKISRKASLHRESRRSWWPLPASHRMAEAGRGVPREAISVRGRVAKIARTGTSHALVATRTNGKCCHWFRYPQTESPSSNRKPSAFSLLRRFRLPLPVCPQLPVWPSSRHPWPPPWSVRDSRGFGARRGWALESVAARGMPPKQERASGRTCSFAKWPLQASTTSTDDGSKWSLMVFLSTAERSWPSTQRWSHLSTAMVLPRRGTSIKKGLALEAARKRKEMTYPELDKRRRQGQVGSIPKLHISCPPWLGPRLESSQRSCWSHTARAWTSRWSRLLNCAAAKAFAQSLLDLVLRCVICDDRLLLH